MAKLFTPYQMSKMTDAAIRKAYSSLRSVANKRLGRLESQGLGKTARTGYKFPTIKSIEESSKATVASMLADVSKFLRDERTTVRGEKKFLNDFQEMMTEKGFGDLVETPDEIYRTLEFLEELREVYDDKMFSSGDALDALQEAERLNIPKDKLFENIDMFISHLEELRNVKPSKGGAEFSSRRINNLIKKWTK